MVVDNVEAKIPSVFQYQFFADKGKTGNFEISVFNKQDLSDEGKQVFSKKATKQFPFDTEEPWETFLEDVEETTKWTC